ncbi:MAG: hypothetical protein AAFO95_18785, partial [Cyanobacteria bacterium J06600_6]
MYSKYPSKIYGFISAAVLAIIIGTSAFNSTPSAAYSPKLVNEILNPETASLTASKFVPRLVAQGGQFTLPPLPYEYDALDAYIDRATMTIHHDKHHAGYVKNLNEAIALYPQLEGQSVEELLVNLESLPADVRTTIRNNGGGHANHTMFWSIMARVHPNNVM